MSEQGKMNAAWMMHGIAAAVGIDLHQMIDDLVEERCAYCHGTTRHNGDGSLDEGSCFFCSKADCKNECMDEANGDLS